MDLISVTTYLLPMEPSQGHHFDPTLSNPPSRSCPLLHVFQPTTFLHTTSKFDFSGVRTIVGRYHCLVSFLILVLVQMLPIPLNVLTLSSGNIDLTPRDCLGGHRR